MRGCSTRSATDRGKRHVVLDDICRRCCSQPFACWQFVHVLCGAMLAGRFPGGRRRRVLSALAPRRAVWARRFVRAGTIVAFVFSVLAVFPTGDRNGADVTAVQPVKLAAMEGLFESTHGAPLAIIGMPDARASADRPDLRARFAEFSRLRELQRQRQRPRRYARELWPPVELTYYAYHIMVGLGTIFAACWASRCCCFGATALSTRARCSGL